MYGPDAHYKPILTSFLRMGPSLKLGPKCPKAANQSNLAQVQRVKGRPN